MRIRTAWLLPFLSLPLLLPGCAASDSARSGRAEPRSYRYTCDILFYDVQGSPRGRSRVQADQARGLPGDMIRWSSAGFGSGGTPEGRFGPLARQDYMEGFGYTASDARSMEKLLSPELYRAFPASPIAFLMKNMIIDVHTFDLLADEAERLKPGETVLFSGSNTKDISLFGSGSKQDLRRMDLTYLGDARRNGRDCAVIGFQADIAPVSLAAPSLAGSTLFWGEIWVSRKDRRIEHASMREHGLLGSPDDGAKASDLQSVYRIVTFESLPPAAR